jgi:hypothetical protein
MWGRLDAAARIVEMLVSPRPGSPAYKTAMKDILEVRLRDAGRRGSPVSREPVGSKTDPCDLGTGEGQRLGHR